MNFAFCCLVTRRFDLGAGSTAPTLSDLQIAGYSLKRSFEIRNHPAQAAGCLFVAVAALEQRGVVLMDFDEIDEIVDSEVGEGQHAIVADPVDPYYAVFDVHRSSVKNVSERRTM